MNFLEEFLVEIMSYFSSDFSKERIVNECLLKECDFAWTTLNVLIVEIREHAYDFIWVDFVEEAFHFDIHFLLVVNQVIVVIFVKRLG